MASIIFDIIVLIILIVTCIVGYVKGFRKYFIGILAAVIATAASAFASDHLAGPVYDRYIRDDVKAHVTKAIEDFDPKKVVMQKLREQGYGELVTEQEVSDMISQGGDYLENLSGLLKQKGADSSEIDLLRQNIDGYFNSELPDTINKQLDETGLTPYIDRVSIPTDQLRECVTRAATQSKEDAADYIVEKAIKPILVGVVRTVLFAVCFAVVMLLLKLVIFISGVTDTIPEVKAADRFAGLVLGAIKGLLYCAVMGWALSFFCTATKNSMTVFNADIGEKTFLFRYFFNFFYK